MNFLTPRVLAIDVGIVNFSFAVVRQDPTMDRPYVVERWENVSLLVAAGYPQASEYISANDVGMTLLSDIAFSALNKFFPEHWVRHSLDFVRIESQPRFEGQASKVAELSSTIYNYFQAILAPQRLCCWKFPDLQMIGAGTKFDGGVYFDLGADSLVPTFVAGNDRVVGRVGKISYAKRKAYGEALVEAILSHPSSTVTFSSLHARSGYSNAAKKDDYCDALILAGVALRRRYA
jgi:hypothetical protein